MLPVKLILCPTDFSGPACTCVRTASELAQHFGAELLLVNVVPALPSVPPDPNYVFKIPEYERYLHADAERHLREEREKLVAKNVKVRTQVGHGSAAEEIVLIAKTEKADLIVISTHGSTGLERLVFGSVAEKVVRLAECPVLTVRQKEEAA
ncbi:MAG TPA: universal stress protein [Terriglobales bacterium]|nr:universal stress protein [Terriglobales bacterium]